AGARIVGRVHFPRCAPAMDRGLDMESPYSIGDHIATLRHGPSLVPPISQLEVVADRWRARLVLRPCTQSSRQYSRVDGDPYAGHHYLAGVFRLGRTLLDATTQSKTPFHAKVRFCQGLSLGLCAFARESLLPQLAIGLISERRSAGKSVLAARCPAVGTDL